MEESFIDSPEYKAFVENVWKENRHTATGEKMWKTLSSLQHIRAVSGMSWIIPDALLLMSNMLKGVETDAL